MKSITLGNLRLVAVRLAEPVTLIGSTIGAVMGWRINESVRSGRTPALAHLDGAGKGE